MTEHIVSQSTATPSGSAPSWSPLGSLTIQAAPATTQILGMAAAVPARVYQQMDLLKLLGYEDQEKARSLFENCAIDQRYLALDEADFQRLRDPKAQNDQSKQIVPLAEAAIKNVLAATGVHMEQLGCMIVTTTSGLHMPAVSAVLAARLGLPTDLVRYDLTGTGCVGAMPTLSLADDYVKANPNKRVLAVCADLGSLVLGTAEPTDKEAMVVNALFGDAAVGMILGSGPSRPGIPEIVDVVYRQDQAFLDAAFVSMRPDHLLEAHISRSLPDRSAALLLATLDALLEKHGLHRDDLKHWAGHPGGRLILDKSQDGLGLSDAQLAPSREVLRQFGNVSSPTCLLSLRELLARERPAAGDRGVIAAIGPGLTVGIALLRWT
ncbi:MAG: chalcone and stilbene synthase domain protein [Cyanobacteria bacterium RYN_339]|nr:chalcone and stilbene synthase domain protein [Cyanobacteria bacterium RYN_339]